MHSAGKSTAKKKTPTKASTKTASKPTTKTTKVKIGGNPKHAAKFNGFVFDSTTNLWSDPKGNVLNKIDSDAKTKEYWKAVKAGTVIPENSNKMTYTEFFV
jgi:hypothetical protein